MNLKETIQAAAEKFAYEVVGLIRTAPLGDVGELSRLSRSSTYGKHESVPPRPANKPGRPSTVDVDGLDEKISGLLGKNPKGLRSEEIQKALKIAKNQAVKVLTAGLNQGTVRKTGEKRSTRYFLKKGA